jgi:hypothetical protein
MTYIVDITLSLVRVLEHAAFFRDDRLSGYAANADFWAAEVRHALDAIAGYDARVVAWRESVKSASSSDAVMSPADLSALTKRLKSAAARFFRVCRPCLGQGKVLEIEQLLGIDIQRIRQAYRD